MMEDLMDHSVFVDRLPEGLEFPADLKGRIHFDPQTRKLTFRGYMSKTDFDRISQLTRDWSFRRKLEELFQVCVPEDDPDPKKSHGFFSMFRKRSVRS
jgi:hypothetical protein